MNINPLPPIRYRSLHRRLYDNLSVVALDVEDLVPGEEIYYHLDVTSRSHLTA